MTCRPLPIRVLVGLLILGLAPAGLPPAARTATAQPSAPSARTAVTVKGTTIPFVRVPRGVFMMGSPPNEPGRGPKEVLTKVTILRDYGMSAHEVTVAEYYALMDPRKVVSPKERNKPMTSVSWDEANEFCKKLSQATGARCRLPDEDEWEYACRANRGDRPGPMFAIWKGDLARDLELFRKGNPMPVEQHASKTFNYNSDGAVDVASYPANAYGLHDMHGNAWEWCGNRGKGLPSDSPGLIHRPIRGGAWSSLNWTDCRSAKRAFELKSTKKGSIGFRVLVEL